MLANEAGTLRNHDVREHSVFMNVAHEQPVVISLGEGISQIKPSAAMSRQVRVIANCFDVVVDVRIHMRPTLFVVHAALDYME